MDDIASHGQSLSVVGWSLPRSIEMLSHNMEQAPGTDISKRIMRGSAAYPLSRTQDCLRCGPMASQRYVPRDYTTRPDLFGKAPSIPWKIPEDGSEVYLLASQIQHHLCLRINDAMKTRSDLGKLTSYSRAVGGDNDEDRNRHYQRLGRVMRGETILRLDDVATAQHHFGDHIHLPDWATAS